MYEREKERERDRQRQRDRLFMQKLLALKGKKANFDLDYLVMGRLLIRQIDLTLRNCP